MEHVRYWGRVPFVLAPMDFDAMPLVRSLVDALRMVCAITLSRAAANPKILPNAKPRTMRELIVVPSIRSREVARGHRSGVRHGEDAL
jgi:hypothetical protein